MSTSDFNVSRRSFLGATTAGIALAASGLSGAPAHASSGRVAEGVRSLLDDRGSTLRVLDAQNRELWRHSSFGPARLQFNGAQATLAVCGEVLVANSGNARVDRFGANGRYLGELEVPNHPPGFRRPVDLAPFNNGVLVADSTAHALYEFDEALRFVRAHGVGELNGPSQLLTVGDETLVLDRGNHRILTLSRAGVMRTFGNHEFYLPASMRIGDDGTIRVTELGSTDELAFRAHGQRLGTANA